MPVVRKSILLAMLLAVAPSALAKEWRGITPLQSTRSDVIRAVGHCGDEDSEDDCVFDLAGGQTVYILFASGAATFHECAKQLPGDTVLLIEIKFKEGSPFAQLVVDNRNFKPFAYSDRPNIGYKGYLDETTGLVINTHKGKVVQLDYIASAKDAHQCASYYQDPKSFVRALICSLPPVISLTGPREPPLAGEAVVYTATFVGKSRYTWHVSAGTIIAGQGTPKITVDTTGLAGQKITVTVEADDRRGSITETTCETSIAKRPDH